MSRRLEWWREVALFALLPLVVMVALIVPAVVTRNENRNQRELLCTIISANITELGALKSVAREIGLPGRFEVPAQLPDECDGVDIPLGPVIGAAIAAYSVSRCTISGTEDDDVLPGTTERDVICGYAGRDYGAGNGRPDVLKGNADRDVLVGGNGADRMAGGQGPDRLFAIDGEQHVDVLRGGPGNDQCFVDPKDVTYSCEQVFGASDPETIAELSRALFGAMSTAES